MLDWPDIKYKFTLSLGSLGTTAIMAELWKPFLPAWLVMVVGLLPLAIFVFVHPGEMPAGLVRAAHVFASAWYVLSVANPPLRREDTAVKLVLPVSSIATARSLAQPLGGELNPPEREWQFLGSRVCDGHDPEGNVIQFRENTF
jgi:hypothetical protein